MILAKLGVLAAALLTSAAAMAGAPILSENFNAPGLQAGPQLLNSSSDNWAATDYYRLHELDGWSFGNATFLARNAAGNGALLLNETGSGQASKLVTGLTAGQTYTLQFNMWGDNIVGGMYGLNVAVGDKQWGYDGVVRSAGYYQGKGGVHQSIEFTAIADSALLRFEQVTFGGEASPIIDDVSISAVPEPETYAMLLGGLALLGVTARRKAKRQQA
jgi:hypothetical protein